MRTFVPQPPAASEIGGFNGQQAVALAARFQPDLVILDIDMPLMNGIEAARAILRTQSVPIIISTGKADEPTLQRLRNVNFGAYLVKPFSQAQLKAAIFIATTRHQWSFVQPAGAAG